MWIIKNGKLIHTTDEKRVNFRTTICKNILDELNSLSKENNTHINYLLETGITKLLESKEIDYNKMPRVNPKNRVLYSTTYDKILIKKIRELASVEYINTNQLIEYCSQLIDLEGVKKANHRYRIEEIE